MMLFQERVNKDSVNYQQGYQQGATDAKSQVSAQVVGLQNQLQAANDKVLAAQSASSNKVDVGGSVRSAVLADRKRIQKIMASSVARYRQEAALKLACETDLSLEQASSILTAMPENKPEKTGMTEFEKQMAKIGVINVGSGCDYDGLDGDGSEEALAAAVIAANQRVNGQAPKTKE